MLLWILGATFLVSLISFIGVLTLTLKDKTLDEILLVLVAFSAGALMGGAFLHLLPESIAESPDISKFIYVLMGFILFFFMEKILHWRHCHEGNCSVHTFTYMNLFGDAIHNFIDGLVIAAAFVTSLSLGIATTFAIAFHEIPQEIGDFGVLVYGGFTKTKALLFNFLVALTAIAGGIIGYFISAFTEEFVVLLLPIAAGGFIYIASSDLIPEIRKVMGKQAISTFSVFILGIILMWFARLFFA